MAKNIIVDPLGLGMYERPEQRPEKKSEEKEINTLEQYAIKRLEKLDKMIEDKIILEKKEYTSLMEDRVILQKLKNENEELKKQLNALDVRNASENPENKQNNEHKTEKDVRKARAFDLIKEKELDVCHLYIEKYETYNEIYGNLTQEEWNFLKEMLKGGDSNE